MSYIENTGLRMLWLLAIAGGIPQITSAAEGTHRLRARRASGDMASIEIKVAAAGDLKLLEGDRVERLPMRVEGSFNYDEKYLSTARHGHRPHTIRVYETAGARIEIDKAKATTELGDDARIIRASGAKTGLWIHSPSQALSRDELDLIDLPVPSLLTAGLLPDEPVAEGDKWNLDHDFLADFLRLEAVAASDVVCRLGEVSNRSAIIELTGHVNGAVGGVSTEMDLQGRFRFQFGQGAIDWIVLRVKETRSIGHVAPGLEAVTQIELKQTPLSEWQHDYDPQYEQLAGAEVATGKWLRFEPQSRRFRLLHDRRWHMIGEESDRVGLRLVDEGELVAQCNVSILPQVQPGAHATLAAFQKDIKRSLGEHFGQFVAASESSDEQGRAVYRVLAEGEASDLPIRWNYYHVADSQGRQMVLVFTMEGGLVARFADADIPLVASVEFLGPEDTSGSKAVSARPAIGPTRTR